MPRLNPLLWFEPPVIWSYGADGVISRVRLLLKKGQPQRELLDVNKAIREMIALLRGEATR